jgi:ABC-type uncharacterized transport system YnjBCD ATPase subunit
MYLASLLKGKVMRRFVAIALSAAALTGAFAASAATASADNGTQPAAVCCRS